MSESWRHVWREGFLPSISTAELEFLRDMLEKDDPRLTQGSTTTPPPLMSVQDWPCEAGDLIACVGVCRADGWGIATVGEAEEVFARLCFEADQRLGEPAGCRWFLNWWDDSPREEVIRETLAEVERALFLRSELMMTVQSVLPADMRKAIYNEPECRTLRGATADWLAEHDHDGLATLLRSLP